ncbi:hypothetical protein NMY22_g12439 [Coprinellus aureogranulatus]|nr:hypothetical protein NMY22_g12439 [Coprinellus aureogranulatus]
MSEPSMALKATLDEKELETIIQNPLKGVAQMPLSEAQRLSDFAIKHSQILHNKHAQAKGPLKTALRKARDKVNKNRALLTRRINKLLSEGISTAEVPSEKASTKRPASPGTAIASNNGGKRRRIMSSLLDDVSDLTDLSDNDNSHQPSEPDALVQPGCTNQPSLGVPATLDGKQSLTEDKPLPTFRALDSLNGNAGEEEDDESDDMQILILRFEEEHREKKRQEEQGMGQTAEIAEPQGSEKDESNTSQTSEGPEQEKPQEGVPQPNEDGKAPGKQEEQKAIIDVNVLQGNLYKIDPVVDDGATIPEEETAAKKFAHLKNLKEHKGANWDALKQPERDWLIEEIKQAFIRHQKYNEPLPCFVKTWIRRTQHLGADIVQWSEALACSVFILNNGRTICHYHTKTDHNVSITDFTPTRVPKKKGDVAAKEEPEDEEDEDGLADEDADGEDDPDPLQLPLRAPLLSPIVSTTPIVAGTTTASGKKKACHDFVFKPKVTGVTYRPRKGAASALKKPSFLQRSGKKGSRSDALWNPEFTLGNVKAFFPEEDGRRVLHCGCILGPAVIDLVLWKTTEIYSHSQNISEGYGRALSPRERLYLCTVLGENTGISVRNLFSNDSKGNPMSFEDRLESRIRRLEWMIDEENQEIERLRLEKEQAAKRTKRRKEKRYIEPDSEEASKLDTVEFD